MRIKRTTEPTTVILFVFIMASLEVSRDLEQLATSAKARFYNLTRLAERLHYASHKTVLHCMKTRSFLCRTDGQQLIIKKN